MITKAQILTENIMALSWKEPYGSLMLHGKIETRTWKTNYRGLVLICASQKPYKLVTVAEISGIKQYAHINMIDAEYDIYTNASLNYGNAFAIGRLIDCRPMKLEDETQTFVEYHPDLYCHVYEDVTPIIRFPWKGKQGWSKIESATKNEIILRDGTHTD